MAGSRAGDAAAVVLQPDGLDALIAALGEAGYRVLGPRERDGVVRVDEVASSADLVHGRSARQSPGRYRLEDRDGAPAFGLGVGPDSLKRWLQPSPLTLLTASRNGAGIEITPHRDDPPKLAFVGVRPCDLAALGRLRHVLEAPRFADPDFVRRRERTFVVAANCIEPADTCFCASMGTGPKASAGYDIGLTELRSAEGFLAESGTTRGRALLARVPSRPAEDADLAAAEAACAACAKAQTRSLDAEGIRDDLYRALDHPRWEETAARCLTCGNCTMVCPTCFCTTVEDSTDLSGRHAVRVRRADSCFTLEYSHVNGGSVRHSAMSRYRQWLLHKFASWHDQFGESGCVGCGRCIVWCPVGIDVTEEVSAVRGRVPAI